MINLPVDEGYAFDYLSILELKLRKAPADESRQRTWLECHRSITDQVGNELMDDVLNSKEYAKLYEINSDTFDAVDRAKTDSIPASTVDQLNFRRYQCKVELQRVFFSGAVTEIKVGYEDR